MQWKVANSLLGDAAETVVCIHMYKALGLVNDVKAVNKKNWLLFRLLSQRSCSEVFVMTM